MEHKITVIVPVYKVESYLHKCVDSIINQTYTNLEIILVDDGSPDNCGAICDEYAKKDIRIVVIHKENGGLSSARNAGLNIAAGDYIAFIDSDDTIELEMFEQMFTVIQSENADMVICGVKCVDENGLEVDFRSAPIVNSIMDKKQAFQSISQSVWHVTVWNKLYKADLFKDIRFPEGKVHEDEFTVHHIFNKCEKIVTTDEKLYIYLQRSGSITSDYSIKRLDAWYAFYDRYKFFESKRSAYSKDKNHSLHLMYSILVKTFTTLDYKENKHVISPCYRRTLFLLIKNGDLKAGKLFIFRHNFLFNIARKIKKLIRFFKFYFILILNGLHSKKQNCFIVATPEHGNLGDHAIVYAEKNLLKDVIEIKNSDYLTFANYFQKKVKPNDIIIIDGGGNLGTLWTNEDDKIADIISRFNKNKIVIFPQTCFYSDTEEGKKRLEKNKNIYSQAEDLTITLRDKTSFDFVKENFPDVNTILVPDIVLSIRNAPKNNGSNGILFCLREDKEKVVSEKNLNKIKEYLSQKNISYSYSDTVINHKVSSNRRNIELYNKWSEFAGAGLVITDRLHGMIFAAITGTPCIAMDNKSGKVSGSYEFISHLPYVVFANNTNELTTYIDILYGKYGEYIFDYPFEKFNIIVDK